MFPDQGVNVIYGDNAQGKTNLLEIIWLFTGNRSFRGAKEIDFINFEKSFSELSLDFFSKGREQNAAIMFSTQGRQICLNSVKKQSLSSLLGNLCAVVFYPDHLSLIKGSPAERRSFLDLAIFQVKPSYAKLVSTYNKTLLQRNSLIKDVCFHSELLDTLNVWDEKLADLAGEIISHRLSYISDLQKESENIYGEISKNAERIKINYASNYLTLLEKKENVKKEILENLLKSRKTDMKLGFTTIGPHRDDIEIFLNERSAKKFASQGQQRSIVLSLKLAEATILKEKTLNKPIILFDDVMSELDPSRQHYILNCIKDWQVFMTCCEETTVSKLVCGKAFRIQNGVLCEK